MELTTALLSVTPAYGALLGLLFVPITARVGLYRVKTKIFLGDGGDEEMLRRMRAQANFVETVPLALILVILMELSGAPAPWLHGLACLLLFGRISHYLGLSGLGTKSMRGLGMVATISVYVVSAGWILLHLA